MNTKRIVENLDTESTKVLQLQTKLAETQRENKRLRQEASRWKTLSRRMEAQSKRNYRLLAHLHETIENALTNPGN